MPAKVQMILDMNLEADAIGHSLIAPILEKGLEGITPEGNATLLTFFEAALNINIGLKRWVDEGQTYEGWLQAFIEANRNEAFLALDTSGRLREMVDKMFNEADLEGYYNLVVKPMNISGLDLIVQKAQLEGTISSVRAALNK